MLKFRLYPFGSRPMAAFGDEPDPRGWLLTNFLHDMYGQEEFYLAELARAEAGATILNCYNNLVDAQMYPDGRVIIEELRYNEQDERDRGPPARTELSLREAKQLILDWLEAKRKWGEEHSRANEPQRDR